jgi:hypothetical protein
VRGGEQLGAQELSGAVHVDSKSFEKSEEITGVSGFELKDSAAKVVPVADDVRCMSREADGCSKKDCEKSGWRRWALHNDNLREALQRDEGYDQVNKKESSSERCQED